MTRFEELADAPTPDGTAREASEAEPPHDDGRLSMIYEESEADLESHVMEVGMQNYKMKRNCWRQLHQRSFSKIPTQMVPDQSVLITVADEQRGHLPKWGRTRDSDTEETYHFPMRSMVEDC
eukprot:5215561-Pyramimonas_sp.AAC.1